MGLGLARRRRRSRLSLQDPGWPGAGRLPAGRALGQDCRRRRRPARDADGAQRADRLRRARRAARTSSPRGRSRSPRSPSAGSPTSARSASSSAGSAPSPRSDARDLARLGLPGPARGDPGQLTSRPASRGSCYETQVDLFHEGARGRRVVRSAAVAESRRVARRPGLGAGRAWPIALSDPVTIPYARDPPLPGPDGRRPRGEPRRRAGSTGRAGWSCSRAGSTTTRATTSSAVTFPIRVLQLLGVDDGDPDGRDRRHRRGRSARDDLVCLSDHLNLIGRQSAPRARTTTARRRASPT